MRAPPSLSRQADEPLVVHVCPVAVTLGQIILELTKRPDRIQTAMYAVTAGTGLLGTAHMPVFRSGLHSLRYEDLGTGRPVVLLHGFTNFGLSWSPQFAPLVHGGYRVIVPDLRGHGASSAADEICTVADLAADIGSLLSHLGIDDAGVCGLSLGGMVALQLAIDQPRRAACLIVANSRGSFSDPELSAIVKGWITVLLQPEGPLNRLRATWPKLANDSFRHSPAGRAVFDGWEKVAQTVKGSSLANVALGMSRFDLRDGLSTIDKPVLVIAGEDDRLFSIEDGREIGRAIRGSLYAIIPGAGHLSNLDSADQFNRLLLSFLSRHFPSS
jgi:3-oxoadipate enol-lactonase